MIAGDICICHRDAGIPLGELFRVVRSRTVCDGDPVRRPSNGVSLPALSNSPDGTPPSPGNPDNRETAAGSGVRRFERLRAGEQKYKKTKIDIVPRLKCAGRFASPIAHAARNIR